MDDILPWTYKRNGSWNRNDMIIEYPQHLKDALAIAERAIEGLRKRMAEESDYIKSDKYLSTMRDIFTIMKPLGVELRHWIKLQKEREGSLDLPGKLDILFKFLHSGKLDADMRAGFYRRCAEKEAASDHPRKITLIVERAAKTRTPGEPAE